MSILGLFIMTSQSKNETTIIYQLIFYLMMLVSILLMIGGIGFSLRKNWGRLLILGCFYIGGVLLFIVTIYHLSQSLVIATIKNLVELTIISLLIYILHW